MNISAEHFDKVANEYDFVATLHNNNDFLLPIYLEIKVLLLILLWLRRINLRTIKIL